MLGSDAIRGYNDAMILCILCEGDSYGYALSREIEARSEGQYSMRETTLYSAINRLEKQGYIAAFKGAETFGRPRTYYTITDAGRIYYQEKRAEWLQVKQIVDRFMAKEDVSYGTNP